jgi:hypothetical protein
MRNRLTALIAALAVAGFVPIGFAAPAEAAPATAKVVVRPVTASGHAAAGFTVKRQDPGFPVDCSYADPSPGAVSRNIEFCSPSAAYAVACWKAAQAGKVLCMRNPRSHKLYLIAREGKFAKTRLASPRDRAPLAFVLTDGSTCQIRDGGAWGQPPHHPNLYGAYSCDRWGAAWLHAKGDRGDSHNGVDESNPSWRIRTGEKKIIWRHIATAYFVGTAD